MKNGKQINGNQAVRSSSGTHHREYRSCPRAYHVHIQPPVPNHAWQTQSRSHIYSGLLSEPDPRPGWHCGPEQSQDCRVVLPIVSYTVSIRRGCTHKAIASITIFNAKYLPSLGTPLSSNVGRGPSFLPCLSIKFHSTSYSIEAQTVPPAWASHILFRDV